MTKELAQGTIEQFEIKVKFRYLIIKNKLKVKMIHKEKILLLNSPGQGGVKPRGSGDPETLIKMPMYHL